MANPIELDFSASGLVTVEQAAEILDTSIKYVRRLRYLGELIPFKLIGSNRNAMIFFRRTDIEAYKAAHPKLGMFINR